MAYINGKEILFSPTVNCYQKEEQTKTVDVTENGTTEIIPDDSKVLSKVTVNVNVSSGGDGDAMTHAPLWGNYSSNDAWYVTSYMQMPYGYYEFTENVRGEITTNACNMQGNTGAFDSIKITGTGGGADAPYGTAYFYSNGSLIASYSTGGGKDNFAFNFIADTVEVSIPFYVLINDMFNRQ